MESVKKLLFSECDYRLPEELMDRFMDSMTEVSLKPNEPLIPYGRFDSNIYVLKSGIVRYAYFDGLKEKTFGFATPGTLMMPFHSYYKRLPSFFQLEACNESVVLKMSKSTFDGFIAESHEFTRWMLTMSIAQLCVYEEKLSILNGTAEERFESLIKNRPEIMESVSLRIIASYLGITPSYLSRLKKKLSSGSEK